MFLSFGLVTSPSIDKSRSGFIVLYNKRSSSVINRVSVKAGGWCVCDHPVSFKGFKWCSEREIFPPSGYTIFPSGLLILSAHVDLLRDNPSGQVAPRFPGRHVPPSASVGVLDINSRPSLPIWPLEERTSKRSLLASLASCQSSFNQGIRLSIERFLVVGVGLSNPRPKNVLRRVWGEPKSAAAKFFIPIACLNQSSGCRHSPRFKAAKFSPFGFIYLLLRLGDCSTETPTLSLPIILINSLAVSRIPPACCSERTWLSLWSPLAPDNSWQNGEAWYTRSRASAKSAYLLARASGIPSSSFIKSITECSVSVSELWAAFAAKASAQLSTEDMVSTPALLKPSSVPPMPA